MHATQNALEYLVLAQLDRLQKDQSRLESLYAQLPSDRSLPKLEDRFMALWTDVDERAARLERMLDELAPLRSIHTMPMQTAYPSYRPAA
ncbi:MAG TPA: hypothetical protein VIX89_13670 [Bryobacteraceae bacterium]